MADNNVENKIPTLKQVKAALLQRDGVINGLKNEKINAPKNSDGTISNGTSGQILQSNGDGTTQWVNKPSGSTSSGGSTVVASEAYDSVAALKEASLSVGDIVKTRGFYAPGDGGDAEYKISDTIPAQYKYCGAKEYEIALVQKLNDGKYALYIPRGGVVNVKACGAKGNCVVAGGSVKVKGDDDSEILQAVFNICANWYTAEKTEQWSIYFPVGNYRIDNPIELTEGSAYRVRGETNTGFSFMTEMSGNSCSIVSYADHIFTGSWERRWNEEVAAGNGNEAKYTRATYTTIDMSGMEFLPQTSGQDLFHNIVLRCSVIKYNRGHNLATFIRGGLEYCTKISYNNFNGFTYALFCETDLDCFAEDKKNNYLNLLDCYISHNYFNGAYASLPIAIRRGGKGDFNYVNFDNNYMDFFEFFFGCAVNFTGNANYNDFHFNQDIFDYMVSLFDQRRGLSLTASTFVSCIFSHMSRVYSDNSQANYVPSSYNTRPWGPFISLATLTNVSITANHIKDCDGFFSTYLDENNIGVGYCTCRITGNIFQTLRNECIRYQYCVTDLYVTNPNQPNSNMTFYPTDFYCDIAEEREYTELPVVSRKHNNDPKSNKTDYYFYKGQCVYLNNKKIRFDGNVFRDMNGNEVSAS